MNKVLIFLGGIGLGSAATYFVMKGKFQKMLDDEIAQTRTFYMEKVKELNKVFSENIAKPEEPDAEVVKEIDISGPKERKLAYRNPDLKDVAAELIKEEGYTAENKVNIRKKMDMPYVISPDEFGDLDYECISLTYYDDGVLADDDDEIIDDVDDTVGCDALDAFGREEGEEEFVVHVRNDARKCDFEICRDFRKYDDVIRAQMPDFS